MMLVWLAACSDYSIEDKNDKPDVFDTGGTFDPGIDSGEDTETTVDTSPPPECPDQLIPGSTLALNESCYYEPTVGTFTPVVEWNKASWAVSASSTECMMMPAVGSMSDDDGDGDADENDTPDIILITYGGPSVIRVVSGDGGAEILNIEDGSVQGQGGVAVGDIDNDGWQDIIAATTSGVVAYDHDGNKMWTSDSMTGHIYGTSDNPAISDMDGDGNPEIIMGSAILDNEGNLLGAGSFGMGGVERNNVGVTSFAVDMDGDGQQEVVTGNALYDINGDTLWYNGEQDGYVAVGNFDSDDYGEIVVSTGGNIRLQDDDGTVLCQAAIPGAGSAYYGGPPTVADFDGDGEPEFACAAGSRYSVFEKDCSVKWQAVTQDASSGNTGSSVFDFEGDGSAEAVYADETRLWVFDGATGDVKLESTEHTNATWLEYPTIADVDGDDHAEIAVCNTSGKHGVSVFGDADNSWLPGRKIWNQHAYHITNVNEDGSIPRNADINWASYNNFRSGDLYAATGGYEGADLVVAIKDLCIDECDRGNLTVWVNIGNAGYGDVETDVTVELMGELEDGSEVVLASQVVTDAVVSGRTIDALQFDVVGLPANLFRIYAQVDHGNDSGDSEVSECDETNNVADWNENLCP